MELVEGSKANTYLYMDPKGFLYRKDGKRRHGGAGSHSGSFLGQTMYFRCSEESCNVRILWRKGPPGPNVLEQRRMHNHTVCPHELAINKFRSTLRKRAMEELDKSLKDIYKEEKSLQEGDSVLPPYNGAISSLMERARKGRLKPKAVRKHLTEANSYLENQLYGELLLLPNSNVEMIQIDNYPERILPSVINFDFRGLIAPVFIPYNSDMTLNLEIIPQYAQYLVDNKIGGVLVNSEYGDGMILSVDQRKKVTEAWISVTKPLNLQLMVQVGGTTFYDVLELARHAENAGVDSILCLPDPTFKPKDVGELTRYLRFVGAAAPKTPLFYDHNPGLSNIKHIQMGKLASEAAATKINSFRGFKYTCPNLEEGVDLLKTNENLVIFWGSDRMMSSAFFSGFHSAIASTLNVLPHLGRGVYENAIKFEFGLSKDHQNVLNEVCKIVDNFGDSPSVLKSLMNIYSPINVGKTARPRPNLSQKQITNLDKKIKALDNNT